MTEIKTIPKKRKRVIKGITVKVCGVTQLDQFIALNELGIKYVGFNFYPQSSRYIGNSKLDLTAMWRTLFTTHITAVFVNPTIKEIQKANTILPKIDTIQLHGTESPLLCSQLQKKYTIIKAIAIDDTTNIQEAISEYINVVDFFLFDTKTPEYGGSGISYDWHIFKNQIIPKPFFISGGIHDDMVSQIKKFSHPNFFGVDVNSKFETSPGIKDVDKIANFITRLYK